MEYLAVTINLDRRPDRWATHLERANGLLNVTRHAAFDGKNTAWTPELQQDFGWKGRKTWRNPYGHHRFLSGAIGVAKSQLDIWRQYAEIDVPLLVLEDDVFFAPSFGADFSYLLDYLKDKEWDLVFLGVTDGQDDRYGDVNAFPDCRFEIRRVNPEPVRMHGGGAFAYLLHPKAITRVLEIVEKDGIQVPIDWFLLELCDRLAVFKVHPHLVTAEVANGKNNVDTDIQRGSVALTQFEVEGFDYIPNKDSVGGDVGRTSAFIPDMAQLAYDMEDCVAFNTLGWLKYQLGEMTTMPGIGLYVKREVKREENPDVAILCFGNPAEPWDGEYIREHGMGGSEECVVYLAEGLAKLGRRVWVYGMPSAKCTQMRPGSNPRYWNYSTYNVHAKTGRAEVEHLIVWRNPGRLVEQHPAKHVYHWAHDVSNEKQYLPNIRVDHTVWLTKYHMSMVKASTDRLKPVVIPNGVDGSLFVETERTPWRCIYGSNYGRGLSILLKLWPKLKKRFPKLTLDIYYGWNCWGVISKEAIEEMKEQVESLKASGVAEHGRIGQVQLAQEYSSSSFWLYPCTAVETFCITAVKAQLGGAIPVVRKFGALDETVKHGFSCSELDKYEKMLFNVFEAYEKDEHIYDEMRSEMMGWAKQYDWNNVAKQWDSLFSIREESEF